MTGGRRACGVVGMFADFWVEAMLAVVYDGVMME